MVKISIIYCFFTWDKLLLVAKSLKKHSRFQILRQADWYFSEPDMTNIKRKSIQLNSKEANGQMLNCYHVLRLWNKTLLTLSIFYVAYFKQKEKKSKESTNKIMRTNNFESFPSFETCEIIKRHKKHFVPFSVVKSNKSIKS